MTKIDIFSGFLGAGKTTLIKKLIGEAFQGEKLVLIENEFGEIGIDGGFLKDAGVQITEMNSGCICCSLVGDFSQALKTLVHQYAPDRILIEPSGVGKLSDVTKAVANVADELDLQLNSFTTVADVNKVKMYMKNFGEFYNDQIEHASAIILSRTGSADEAKVAKAVELLRQKNPGAVVVTTAWDQLTGAQLRQAMEGHSDLVADLLAEAREKLHHEHHYDEHGVCSCGHHHGEHEHHEHEHHHDHGCSCGHDHHDHHHADEVFTSWGRETARKYTRQELEEALQALDEGKFGQVLRAKGILPGQEQWFYFDYVPGEAEVRTGGADVTGRLCVIGSGLDEDALARLFHL